ncbi:hypothetical protein DW959_02590 [Clostridium sp. AM46-21]|nr:hypothetical protein DW959_02590 [Clostridium sp. AM46-21]
MNVKGVLYRKWHGDSIGNGGTDLKVQEGYQLGSIVRRDFCPALQIDADSEQVVTSMLNQNFVPIVDGRNALCGILTRKRLIEFLAQARDKKE